MSNCQTSGRMRAERRAEVSRFIAESFALMHIYSPPERLEVWVKDFGVLVHIEYSFEIKSLDVKDLYLHLEGSIHDKTLSSITTQTLELYSTIMENL